MRAAEATRRLGGFGAVTPRRGGYRVSSLTGWTAGALVVVPLAYAVFATAFRLPTPNDSTPAMASVAAGLLFAIVSWASGRRGDLPVTEHGRTTIEIGNDVRAAAMFTWCAATIALTFIVADLIRGAFTPSIAVAWLAAVVGSLAAFRVVTEAPEVVVGADGFMVRTPRRRRFYAFADIDRVVVGDGHVTLHRGARSERVRLFFVPTRQRAARMRDLAEILAERLAEHAVATTLLERGERSVAEWREALAELAARDDRYRQETLSREQLVRIVEQPKSPPERRVGAALALASLDDPTAKSRIRVVGAACVNPRVRVALEQIAGGAPEDDVIDRASRATE